MLTLCYYSQNYSRIIIGSLSATNATSYLPPFLRRNPHHFLQIRAFISPNERFVNLEYCLYTSNKLMYCMLLGKLSCKLSVTQSVLLCMCSSLLLARLTWNTAIRPVWVITTTRILHWMDCLLNNGGSRIFKGGFQCVLDRYTWRSVIKCAKRARYIGAFSVFQTFWDRFWCCFVVK